MLVEYRQLRKANAFVDRRFGEEDESLTAEEKAIARFQKQRMKEFGGVYQAYDRPAVSLLLRKLQLLPFTCSTCTILLSSVAARANPQLHAFAGDKFSLNDDQEGGGELLTHMGRNLGAGDTHEVACHRPHAA